MKIFRWIKDNPLLLVTLFLFAFIPLYPKLPLLDIKNTWVYIRVEDFLVAFAWLAFFIAFIRKKATLKTPLSIPILVFWIVGAIATMYGVLFIFPKLANVYPNLALLNYLRRIEYLSVFFLAYSSIKKKEAITPIMITLFITMLAIFLYGIGQRMFGFPAFQTMNEEFAKGIPLRLSALSRIPSTFAGHYDLAAYLILLIPVLGSMIFGYKKWIVKILFFLLSVASLILLLMTASRVSFAVYMVSIAIMLVFQKQKKYIIPVFILSILLLKSFTGISQRFAATFTQVDLVVDSRTGKAIGVASEFGDGNIVISDELSNGENLPTGSRYINLAGGGQGQDSNITYKRLVPGSGQQEIITKAGKVIVKKAFAYDVSFTTRFQGEWPNALKAFERNPLLGSGYSSITLATDNSFLRMLGETGLLGFFSFIGIFVFVGIYLIRLVPEIDDRRIKSLIWGVLAGNIGLALNGTLIDVYEASKVAFVLWILLGVTLGLAHLYQKKKINYLSDMRRIFTSTPAFIIGIVVVGILVFAQSFSNYFTADDFTWLRWAADCKQIIAQTGLQQCSSLIPTITHYFTNSQGFFYRPGTKAYFFLAYPIFELFPTPFHVVSIMLHIIATILIFFIAKKLLKSQIFGFIVAIFFLFLSIHAEALYWISVTGHLVTAVLILLAFLCFIYWRENKNKFLFIVSFLSIFASMFFHEYGTTGPLLLIAYDLIDDWKMAIKKPLAKWYYLLLLLPIGAYYLLRTLSQSVWFQGDYSYNMAKLPFNIIGNTLGYFSASVVGPIVLPFFTNLRTLASHNLPLTAVVVLVALVLGFLVFKVVRRSFVKDTSKMLLVSGALFIIPLLPFLGLGNISPRYAYLSSFGVVFFLGYVLQQFAKEERKYKVTLALVALISVFFAYLHYSQLNKINKDWSKAGSIVNNTLVGINLSYAQPGSLSRNPIFYFVNTPIKYGDAWVFPLGPQDALWFSFQDVPLQTVLTNSEKGAEDLADKHKNVSVFMYDQDGNIGQYTPPTPTPTPGKAPSKLSVTPTPYVK
jgi:hypothetical protein